MAGKKGRSGGHNRKPRHIHLVGGTFRPDRHGNREQAKQETRANRVAIALSPPAYLARNAKAVFRRVARGLRQRGDISRLDRDVLAGYAQAVGELSDAERAIAFELREARRILAAPAPAGPQEAVEAHASAVVIARRIVGHSGRDVPGKDGTWIRNPAVITANAAARRLRDFAGEFGMTPAALARLRSTGEIRASGEHQIVGDYPPELDDEPTGTAGA